MQSTPRRPLRALPSTVAIVLFLGCGGAPENAAKTPGAERAPASLPEALADLDRAETELGYAIGSPTFAAPPAPTTPPTPRSDEETPRDSVATAEPPPPPAAAQPGGARGYDSQPAPAAASPCTNACRALASMARSADHVCGLAGEGDTRCESARSRVERATDRVRAQCPGCR